MNFSDLNGLQAKVSFPSVLIHPKPPANPKLHKGRIQREAYWFERRTFLKASDHPVADSLVDHYMDNTGKDYVLSGEEMISLGVGAHVNNLIGDVEIIKRSQESGSSQIRVQGQFLGQDSVKGGGLANFTVYMTGLISVNENASGDQPKWVFRGVMTFYDIYDFDPKPYSDYSLRGSEGEDATRLGDKYVPGRPFRVLSEKVSIYQDSSMSEVRINARKFKSAMKCDIFVHVYNNCSQNSTKQFSLIDTLGNAAVDGAAIAVEGSKVIGTEAFEIGEDAVDYVKEAPRAAGNSLYKFIDGMVWR